MEWFEEECVEIEWFEEERESEEDHKFFLKNYISCHWNF